MKDLWDSGDPYEYFMGRWSSLVARLFIDWLSPASGLKWLDIGCGSGALSQLIIDHHKPVALTAIDQSEGFVKMARKRLGSRVQCRVGNALSLPLEDASADITVSGLVLNFITEPEKALFEMKRVSAAGGMVAGYIWDYAGKMDFLRSFWDAAVELKPEALSLHESRRFQNSSATALQRLFENVGLVDIKTISFEIATRFKDFDDYWKPFLGGQGPAPSFVMSLDDVEKNKLAGALKARLPYGPDGTIAMTARAIAVQGKKPL